jgi:hypothetical protein
MASIQGVKVTGIIVPSNTLDTYAVIDSIYGIDGLRNLSGGTTDLNSITTDRRRAGMLVGVNNGGDYYKLNPAPWTNTISDWTLLTLNEFTGGTVTGATQFTNGLTANTFSATTYLGLPLDIHTTGMTFNPSTYDITIKGNDGVDYTQSLGILATDMSVTGGTYNINTGVVTFTNNSGGTFNVTGFTSGMTDSFTTSANLSGETIQFNNNLQGNNFYNVSLTPLLSDKFNISGGTISGATQFTNGLTANTISATTYQNVNHNTTTGLQGGLPSEYYHLGSSQYARVLNLIYVNNSVTFSVTPTTGEKGSATTLTLNYNIKPNDDTINSAIINPGSYDVTSNADGLPHTQAIGSFNLTTAHTLSINYTRNGSGLTSTNTATYTTYAPQWNGLSTSVTGVTGNTTYAAVTALGLNKVVQSSTVQTLNVLTTNNYIWLISTKQNAAITQAGFTTTVSAVGVEDGSFWWQKQILLTLADGVTTQTLYTYRTQAIVNNTTSVVIQIS